MRLKLALVIQTPEVETQIPVALLSGSFSEKLEKASKLRVDGVELMPADPAALDAAHLREMLQRYDLEVAAVGSGGVKLTTGLSLLDPDPSRAEEAEARLRGLIDLAAGVGSQLVTIGSFRGWLAPVGAGGEDRLAAILRAGGDYAQARGVRLVLEPLNRYEADLINNAEQGLAFVRTVAHPAVGLLLDTYHVNIEESSWTVPFRELMRAGVLWHVHLGDNNRLPPGQGLIDFEAIVLTLKEIGFSGYLSAELLAKPDPDTAAEQTARAIRPLLD
jgi:5-keto-L-gluconate epimerase